MACANAAGIGEALKEFVTKNKEQNGELLSNFIWGKMKKMNIGDYILEYKGNKRDVMYAANVDRNSPENKNTWAFFLHPKNVEDMAYECARLFLYDNTAYYTRTDTGDVRYPVTIKGGKRRKTNRRTNMRKRRSTRRRKL